MRSEIDISKKVLLLVLFFLCSFLFVVYFAMDPSVKESPSTAERSGYPSFFSYADDQIRHFMELYHIPCFALAMVDDQSVMYQRIKGYQDVRNHIAAGPDTLFRVCSISKLFTALEIMRLYEDGLVDIDRPISFYIPYFSIKTRFREQESLTLRKILAHRSGLPRNGCLLPWHRDGDPHVLEDVVRSLKDSYMAYPPGYRYKYSNVAFDILGHVIEKKRKAFFAEYMDTEVLPQTGMNSSTFAPSSSDIARTATGYHYRDGALIPYASYQRSQIASSNLHVNLSDMCEFIRFIFRGGSSEKGQIIKEDTLEMMFHPQYSWPGDPHENGLAWRTDTRRLEELAVFHHGICQGTQSLVLLLPERKLGLFLVCTSSGVDDFILMDMGFQMLSLLLEIRYGIKKTTEHQNVHVENKNEIEDPGEYEGSYCLDGEKIKVFTEGKDLKVRIEEGTMDLVPLGENNFILSSREKELKRFGNIEIRFFPDSYSDQWLVNIFRGGVYIGTAVTCPVMDIDSAAKWQKLSGEYEAEPRSISRFTGKKQSGWAKVILKERVLYLPSHRAVLKPISPTELVIMGGLFDGETMTWDPQSGYITWQDVIYSKKLDHN